MPSSRLPKRIGSGGSGGGADTLTEFYVSWLTVAAVAESLTTSPDGNLGLSTRQVHLLSSITTPNGDTLDNYAVVIAEVQLFFNSLWSCPKLTVDPTGVSTGVESGMVGGSTIYIQSGNGFVGFSSALTGGGHGFAGSVATAPARIRIIAIK